MADPISLFPDASDPVSDRSNITCEEAFCFCSLRVHLWDHQVQYNKVGVSEVLKISMFREMSICFIQWHSSQVFIYGVEWWVTYSAVCQIQSGGISWDRYSSEFGEVEITQAVLWERKMKG